MRAVTMKPTLSQRFFAHNGPLRLALAGSVLGSMTWTAAALLPVLEARPGSVLKFLALLGVAGLLGLLVGLIAASLCLAPIYHLRARCNGAPFQCGDRVMILAGKHRGRTTRVDEVWRDHWGIRVDLGPDERDKVQDVYADYQLCRCDKSPDTQKLPGDGEPAAGPVAAGAAPELRPLQYRPPGEDFRPSTPAAVFEIVRWSLYALLFVALALVCACFAIGNWRQNSGGAVALSVTLLLFLALTVLCISQIRRAWEADRQRKR